jgi:hypothetical protein
MNESDKAAEQAWREQRSEPREAAHDPARLLLDRDDVWEALIVDRSLKGLRLRLPKDAPGDLTLTFMALDLNRGMIHQVKVIWKAYPDIGVQVQSSFNVRTGEGPQAAAMRRLWVKATSAGALKPVRR